MVHWSKFRYQYLRRPGTYAEWISRPLVEPEFGKNDSLEIGKRYWITGIRFSTVAVIVVASLWVFKYPIVPHMDQKIVAHQDMPVTLPRCGGPYACAANIDNSGRISNYDTNGKSIGYSTGTSQTFTATTDGDVISIGQCGIGQSGWTNMCTSVSGVTVTTMNTCDVAAGSNLCTSTPKGK